MLFQKRAVLNNFDIYIFIYIYSQNLYKMLMLTTYSFSICYKIILWFFTTYKGLQIMRKLY